ncbi:UNVERIFIED_CONTAM: Retrovirus-related Pol polyprotein from transposon RE1 [Sesamum latifolium]|uniref:Retrovirus-related Pol polyprotein from transposon RE1 n=1 Tax=Sesamum latifolium TaxID=2727402 RepID=A0AAW2VX28_9LAMI
MQRCNFEDFSDGSKQHVDTVGNVQLSNTILLTSVLHVPSLKFNLLSDHRTSQTVGIGRLLGKLYILDESSFKTDTINDSLHTLQEQSLTVDTLDVNLWHKRLGHTSTIVLNHLKFLNKMKTPLDLCEICPLAKQPRMPFTLHNKQATEAFDLVHMDIWGPYNRSELPRTQEIAEGSSDNNSVKLPAIQPEIELNSEPVLRRSSRAISKPAWMQDFYCTYEPRSYKQACQSQEWTQAMKAELDALHKNNTWDITPLPKDKRAIGCRWIYKLKLKADGSVDKYKARLVAKGYNQIEGIDYVDSFSPVAKAVTVRVLLAVAASKNWLLHHVDVNNAFLHDFLEEDIYMEPPEGYQVIEGNVCKLKRSLYGLKQASRQWNVEFTSKVEAFGFVQSKHDHCLFTKSSATEFVLLLVYVDDILIAGDSATAIHDVKTYLNNLFTIKDLGVAKYYLGLEIARSNEGVTVTQAKYIRDLLLDTGMAQAKAASTPLPTGIKFSADTGDLLSNPEAYRRLIGRILYLGFTRPDISHAAQQLSQFLQHPCRQHWDAAHHLLRYLKGTPNTGLFFPAGAVAELVAYSDADWASCLDTRRSLTGFCIFLGSAIISWKTKKQNAVSRSTAKAEYRSMASTTCELIWIYNLLVIYTSCQHSYTFPM